MIRKFYINMYQKGQLKQQLQNNIDLVAFYATDNKTVQIIEFDEDTIKDYFKSNYEVCFLHILGIDKYNSYRDRSLMRECTNDNKEGYKSIELNQVGKETEKAYFIKGLDNWIPKSQTLQENNKLYIKDWIFFKNLF